MTPKSVEASKYLAYEFWRRAGSTKGKPADRMIQKRIMAAVESLADWTKGDGKSEPNGFLGDARAIDAMPTETDEEKAARLEALEKHKAWLEEPVFIEIGKKERAWIWATFAKEWEGEIFPGDEKGIEDVAVVLGKRGVLEDMRTEAEQAEETETDDGEPEDGTLQFPAKE